MTDLDQLLDEAASDAHNSVRSVSTPQSSSIVRRARRRTAVLTATPVLVIGFVATGILLMVQTGGEVAAPDDALITSEMILEDGVVTEDEYRAGAVAVAVCLTAAGFEAQVDFDNPNGHAGFSSQTPSQTLWDQEQFNECLDAHLSRNVVLGWAAALGQLNLEELRQEDTAVTACVEERTGEDFGDLSYDQFGYLTEHGQQTRDAAFEYQDHQPWGKCRNDLGYAEEYKAETRALLECVETQTGEDFGELEFDDTGHPTEASQLTLRKAGTYQNDQAWEACRTELGLPD